MSETILLVHSKSVSLTHVLPTTEGVEFMTYTPGILLSATYLVNELQTTTTQKNDYITDWLNSNIQE